MTLKINNIRDLLAGPPHPSESLTMYDVLADQVDERSLVPDPLAEFTARLPGDVNDHPLAGTAQNPRPGTSVLELSRLVRDGSLTEHEERAARIYIDQYQKWTGERVYNPRNHEPISPVEQQYADENTPGPIHRADGFRR